MSPEDFEAVKLLILAELAKIKYFKYEQCPEGESQLGYEARKLKGIGFLQAMADIETIKLVTVTKGKV